MRSGGAFSLRSILARGIPASIKLDACHTVSSARVLVTLRGYVRFTPPPESGQKQTSSVCLLCAKSGHMRCSKMTACSSDDDFRGEADQLGRICSDNAGIAGAPTIFNFDVATFAPPGFLKYLLERRDPTGCVRIACSEAHQYTNAPHPLRLLRPRHERPAGRRTAQ